ncbi:MAG: HlyD family type I secretion periplasmic adaptor subunit [Pseudomonadota bacterium]
MSIVEASPREIAEKSGFADRMPDVKLPKAPPMRVRQLTFMLFFLGFGVFGGLMAWASVSNITSAVVASGVFRVANERLVVQHLEGGLVNEIRVVEGEVVEEGQILAVIDGTRTKSQKGILRSQLVSALSQEARLTAELEGAENLALTPQIASLIAEDPRLEKIFVAQQSIHRSNQEMVNGRVGIIRDRKLQFHEQTNGFMARQTAFQEQLDLLEEQIDKLEVLYEKGLVTGPRMASLRQSQASILGNMGSLDSSIANVQQRMAELDEQALQLQRDRLNGVTEQLLRAQEAVFDIEERLNTVNDMEERRLIRAPQAGKIVGLTVNTPGSVISAGHTLLEIVPTDAPLVVEAQVRPTDIDEVVLGGSVQVRLTAYNARNTAPVNGTVVHVSADSMTDSDTGADYFRVDVEVLPEEMATLGESKLQAQPGMPAQVMIETGELTVMDYILEPVLLNLETALKEGS